MARFEQFLKERRYLGNVSERSIEWYELAFKWLPNEDPTEGHLKQTVIRMRENGLSARSINSYRTAIKAYLHWLKNPETRCCPGCSHPRIARMKAELSGNERVHFHVRERISPELAAVAAEIPPSVAIPQQLSHALALKTEKLLASGKESDNKLLVAKTGTAAHLVVSRQQLPRALRIMNALFLAVEERGYVVSRPKKEEERLTVSVEGESVAVSMQEVLDSERHVLTPVEGEHPWRAPKCPDVCEGANRSRRSEGITR